MMNAIKSLGDYSQQGEIVENEASGFVENPDVEYVLAVELEDINEELKYKRVSTEEFERSRIPRYLYRRGAPNGPDITPTSKITKAEKTLNNKIIKCLMNIAKEWKFYELSGEEKEYVESIKKIIAEDSHSIIAGIERENPKSKRSNLLTIKINGKYLGDFKLFQKILIKNALKGCYNKYGKESIGKNSLCCICHQKQNQVFGFVSTFPFYTVDKAGMVTGGFRQSDSWKNYPVCPNCAVVLDAGKKYLKDNLNFLFYGFRYLLIPQFNLSGTRDKVMDILRDYEKNPSMQREKKMKLTNDEREILGILSEQQDSMCINLMFYEEKQSGSVFKILLMVEEVPPSRFRRLFDEKNRIESMVLFQELPFLVNDKNYIQFNFSVLRNFFGRSKTDPTYDRYFLELVDKIFRGNPIEFRFLLKYIMEKIKGRFRNQKGTFLDSFKGYMLISYLNNLGVLRGFKGKEDTSLPIMDEKVKVEDCVKTFFEEHHEFFNSPAKKAIFLTGCLTQYLLNIQRLERGATPFRNRLKGLNMDMRDIARVFKEAQNKLEEYKKNYYTKLEKTISSYFVSFDPAKCKLFRDEINFCFVLGMNLGYLFKKPKEEEEPDNE